MVRYVTWRLTCQLMSAGEVVAITADSQDIFPKVLTNQPTELAPARPDSMFPANDVFIVASPAIAIMVTIYVVFMNNCT
jgi:hypothetical protein